jgi:membrane protease subunit (stomatin/prohibitin family)
MALWDKVKGQLRSVIEWEDAAQDTLFELWSKDGDEIKNASKMIVKPGQGAIFLYEGKIEAIHTEEGLYELSTANIPFWTTLTKLMQRFESEHKVGIYYYWQTKFLNQKWGTASPIRYDDPVYKFPVELRCHGNFTFRITDPANFFVNVVGGTEAYPVDTARRVITDRFVMELADVLAEAGLSYADIDKNRIELSEALVKHVGPVCSKLGFELNDFRIEGTDFDAKTKERIGRIADMTAEAAAAERAGLNYAQVQQLEALRDAAKNEGGFAGAGVGLGAGLGLGQTMAAGMAGGMGAPVQQQPQQADPNDPMVRLQKLKGLLDGGLITQEEYDKKRAAILADI